MMNVHIFPSRQIALYTMKLFITRSLAVLVALVLILMLLDLLGESGKILKVSGNGDAELWRYVSLRLPILISRFLPFSVLLGTLIALAGLNQHSEVVAMKAAGISAHQILAPLILASFGLAGIAFAFNEAVVVDSARTVTAWSDNDYRPIPRERGILTNVWVMHGDDLVQARHVGGRGAGFHAEDLTIYERDRGTALQRVVEAERAVPAGNGWRLEDVRVYDAAMNLVRRQDEMAALPGLDPQSLTLSRVDPEQIDFFTLRERIEQMERAGRPTEEARAGMWHKISGPLSTILMPLLAATAAFGLARSGHVLLRATIGMALGFAYFVADNFSLAMGNMGAYPPLLAAWAPFVLFLLIGETVLIRSEE
jgi:lipopolysaccharide export system permease protein